MTKILIIDDDDGFREMLHEMLEREGFIIFSAPDGAEGIKIYMKENPELVITDIIMPEKEGLETILELKKNAPELKIIAISGGGRSQPGDYLRIAKYFGAIKTLAKPFSKIEILEAISEVMEA
jgi:CheY-like chemotaxis protein